VIEKARGTPCCAVSKVAVTVIGELPATKVEDEGDRATVMSSDVTVAMLYSVNVGPGYAAGVEPLSMIAVLKTAVTAGEEAELPGPVSIPRFSVSLKPGLSCVLMWLPSHPHSIADADAIFTVRRKDAPHEGVPLNAHPVGALNVMAWIA